MAGDREGAVAAARRLAKLFPLHIELQHHLLPDDDLLVSALAALADELGLPTVVTNDAHYARGRRPRAAGRARLHPPWSTLDSSGHLRRANGEYYLKGVAELAALPPACRRVGVGRPESLGRGVGRRR